MQKSIDPALLDSVAAGTYLGVSPKTLVDWRCRGRGPRYVKLGSSVRYRRQDLDDFVARRVRESAKDGSGV